MRLKSSSLLIALAFGVALSPALRVSPAIAQDAAAKSKEALESILKSLEKLGGSPAEAQKASKDLQSEIDKSGEEIQKLEAEIQKSTSELKAKEERRDALRRRVEALKTGKGLVEKLAGGATAPATTNPAPATPPPAKANPPAPQAANSKGLELFGHTVGPILRDNCASCHDKERKKGGLDLSTRETMLVGGENGSAVVPGKPDESRLYRLVAHLDEPHMPYKKDKLPEDAIAAIKEWITAGAPFADVAAAPKPEKVVTDADRKYWAFAPLAHPEPPHVKNAEWPRTPIDKFILAKMEDKGVAPNAPADRRKLIRRASFDLVGLPPTPDEVEAFVNDKSPDAYEKLVDRLLASPHFGERWARHWLDISRFAESHGYEQDYDRPYAFYFRDFVIKAFNMDLPFNTFVQWQIAGDEIAPDNELANMATGFLAAGVHSTQITKNQVEKERYDELDDMTMTLGTSMLGMTIGCARCHDHKFDPIPTRDYYRILSTFTTTVRSDLAIKVSEPVYRQAKAKYDREHAPLAVAMAIYESDVLPGKFEKWFTSPPKKSGSSGSAEIDILEFLRETQSAKPTEAQRAKWMTLYRNRDSQWRKLYDREREDAKLEPKPDAVKVLVASEGVEPIRNHTQGDDFFKETYFLKRGNPNDKQGVATQGFLQVLERTPEMEKHWQVPPPQGWRTSYRRRSLANWITDADEGAGHLLARVIVNRLWQHHMGRGIVGTPNDFGVQGEPPTHPELLDWLAGELIRNGWRLKPIHKLIMMSAAYMQSAERDPKKMAADDHNGLFWRYPRRRLESEIIRDAMLSVSGLLDPEMFGPGALDSNQKRRGIYFTTKRSRLVPMMILFDGPDSLGGLPQRAATTVAPQALMMMNNDLTRDCATHLAARVRPAPEFGLDQAVRSAYLIALARQPNDNELADSLAFIKEQTDSYKSVSKGECAALALTDFAQTLMELNEFIYVD